MKRARKFRDGDVIATVEEAVGRIMAGQYLMCRGKPMHSSWLSNQSLLLIASTVRRGDYRVAVSTNEGETP